MDNKPPFNDSCEDMKSLMAVYTILEAAALWCGITKQELPAVIKNSNPISDTSIGRSIYRHPYVSCIEPYTRAIAQAVDDGSLPHTREDGKILTKNDMAAHERRHVTGVALKKWISTAFPEKRPAFLFDDLERDTHTSISADSYRALLADRDALKVRLEDGHNKYKKLQNVNMKQAEEIKVLNGKVGSSSVTDTTQRNYELAIGLLTKALADKAGANCGTKENPNISGLSELLQQYLPADSVGSLSNKALSISTLRKRLKAGYDSLENS